MAEVCGEPDRQEGMGTCVREPHDDPWHWNEHDESWAALSAWWMAYIADTDKGEDDGNPSEHHRDVV